MFNLFEFLITIFILFLGIVYVIYADIKKTADATKTTTTADEKTTDTTKATTTSDTKSTDTKVTATTTDTTKSTDTTTATTKTTDKDNKCKLKCLKPTQTDGNCFHPSKYNPLLKKKQEIKSQLICPWQCSSTYSDDPSTCQFDDDCSGCTPTVSFPNKNSKCPNSTYGCCEDGITEKTDEFGNNCLGLTGATGATGHKEGFTSDEKKEQSAYIILQEEQPRQNQNNRIIYPACPNINHPNQSPFQKEEPAKKDSLSELGTISYRWSTVTDYPI